MPLERAFKIIFHKQSSFKTKSVARVNSETNAAYVFAASSAE
jgi:hypothetical protein